MSSSSEKKKNLFKTEADVENWIINPLVNPINGKQLSPMSKEYYEFYLKAFNIMRKIIAIQDIYFKFPKVHLLFGDLDFIFYRCIKTSYMSFDYNSLYEYDINKPKELYLCELLFENIEDTIEKTTILETEIEILKNRFSNIGDGVSNFQIIKSLFDKYNKIIINLFLNKDYISNYEYENISTELFKDINKGYTNKIYTANNKLLKPQVLLLYFIHFTSHNKMNNGETIIQFLRMNKTNMPEHTEWINEYINIFDYNQALKIDIEKCFSPYSGIIENYEDKKYLPMKDPIDDFFEDFENKLMEIKKPIYSQLIDLTTFKAKNNLMYLNNVQYRNFKREKDIYDRDWKRYQDNLAHYEITEEGNLPTPPIKPIITLPWGKEHTIGKEIDPMHIKDDVFKKFTKEYEKAKPIIEKYNIIKNMSYKELIKHMGPSSTSVELQLNEENELLSMTKKDIVNNILYDYSELADKCSEHIDILTNEELDDENYPLAKLQLMVRLKVYIPGTTKYRTECIYAPKLYNYLIKCINNKEDFVNPVTKTKYTEHNINELMKIIKIIDPKIERPVFIKHRNDTLLQINYNIIECDARSYYFHSSFGNGMVRFYYIYISRLIGGLEYRIYDICVIPADIEITGDFASGTSDITSNTMLFRIFKLFNEGKLLHNYIPPYNITLDNGMLQYIKPQIHFNRYNDIIKWIFEDDSSLERTKEERTKESFINMFKHYAEEINNYIY